MWKRNNRILFLPVQNAGGSFGWLVKPHRLAILSHQELHRLASFGLTLECQKDICPNKFFWRILRIDNWPNGAIHDGSKHTVLRAIRPSHQHFVREEKGF